MLKATIIFGIALSFTTLPTTSHREVGKSSEHYKAAVQTAQPIKQTSAKEITTVSKKGVKKVVKKPKPKVVAKVSGSCDEWIAQAGISDVYHAKLLIGGESGCRPNAVNPYSGACGIPQSLPCGKMKCSLQDPVCQLRWMESYVKDRYGSWRNAYYTWLGRSPHWY